MKPKREKQLAYSLSQPRMLDETSRRTKARKIVEVLKHFLGREDLKELRVIDIGCSAGIITVEFADAGADVVGVDIDEPGLEIARQRFGDRVRFERSDGESLPFPPGSFDIVVLNQIYEHVVDPQRVVAEIERVLSPSGIAYLGLGNRLGIMEPHYRLPFLSWLPRPWADRYVRWTKRADHYYERFMTRADLRDLFSHFHIWDYTLTVVAEPARFGATDQVPARLARTIARIPPGTHRALLTLVPTYIWIGSKRPLEPRGGSTIVAPKSDDR